MKGRSVLLVTLVLSALLLMAGCQAGQQVAVATPVLVTQVVTQIVQEEGATVVVTQLVEVEVTAEVPESTPEPEATAGQKVLRIGAILDDYRFDPDVPTDVTVGMGSNSVGIFETLTRMDEEFRLQPLLATTWEYDSERSAWVFELRDDVFFHDGEQLTAQHVADHFNHIAQESFMAGLLEIEGSPATAADEFTVEIVSNNVQLPFRSPAPSEPASLHSYSCLLPGPL